MLKSVLPALCGALFTTSAMAQTAPAPTPAAQRVTVTAVQVNSPPDATDEFQTVFTREVSAKLARCVKGTYPVTLQVDITRYHRANPSLRDNMGPGSNLQGEVRLYDPATRSVLATHAVRTTGAGWTNMKYQFETLADIEAQMARDFADQLCRKVFTSK
jgi:hypothetical protein